MAVSYDENMINVDVNMTEKYCEVKLLWKPSGAKINEVRVCTNTSEMHA